MTAIRGRRRQRCSPLRSCGFTPVPFRNWCPSISSSCASSRHGASSETSSTTRPSRRLASSHSRSRSLPRRSSARPVRAACDLAKQIWERAKAETWSGGPVNPLTLAVLAEIVLHHENGASNTLVDDEEYYMDQRATAELMVAVLSFARSAGAGSDLLPMEGRFLPPALLKGGRSHG